MNCKKCRDILLSDYIDREVDQETKREVEAHLQTCDSCADTYTHLNNAVLQPLTNAPVAPVPSELWHQIRVGIEPNSQKNSSGILAIFKPVFLFASFCLLLLSTVFVTRLANNRVVSMSETNGISAYLTEQAEYLQPLQEETNTVPIEEYADFGTDIEEYLL